jgi:hypothetical protein
MSKKSIHKDLIVGIKSFNEVIEGEINFNAPREVLYRHGFNITFADRSKLNLYVDAFLPPDDLIGRTVPAGNLNFFVPPNPDGVDQTSTANRLLYEFIERIETIPQASMDICPECGEDGICLYCDGKGCVECYDTGDCQNCDGIGYVVIDE